MSKRRHRTSGGSQNMNQGFRQNTNRFPFGINPQQLLGMLGGDFDMNKLGSMLSSMNMEGFDLNSMNQQMNWMNNNPNNNMNNSNMNNNNMNNNSNMNNMNNNSSNSFNLENIMNAMNSMNIMGNNQNTTTSNNNNNNNEFATNNNVQQSFDFGDDENIEILLSLRKIVDPNKVEFVDKIIEMYNNGAFKED